MRALLRIFLLLIAVVLDCSLLFADGSRDLYPAGVQGNRAFMVSTASNGTNSFYNQAAHYVYVRAGETIAVASSAQGIGEGHIRLIDPNGIETTTYGVGDDRGRIQAKSGYTTRQAELAGPDVGYTPYKHLVQTHEEGVWRVEFVPPNAGSGGPANVRADAVWQQPNGNSLIAAWDISVRDSGNTAWVNGRVFTHVLNLYLTSTTLDDEFGAFYGKNYVLTKDGYVYKVDGNGSHGISFYYFVNSSGLLNQVGAPSYKSSNAGTRASFHSPNAPDNGLHITHKMMYTMPDMTMPNISSGAVPGGSTWLYNEIQIAEIKDIALQQIEGGEKYINKKGTYIQFETNYVGRYKIVLESKSVDYPFVKRELFHEGNIGLNNVLWDGLDGQGNFVLTGENYPISISVALLEGEIHFPYFDMEINPNGIIVYRVNTSTLEETPAIVYWDDSDIIPGISSEQSYPLVNLEGVYSDVNGHAWGSYRNSTMPRETPSDYNGNYGAHSFGNERAMDTWSYAAHMQKELIEEIIVRIADLEVVSLTVDKDTVELGDIVTYTVGVRNNGPLEAIGAEFEFDLPDGFIIQNVTISSGCATEVSRNAALISSVRSVLNIPDGCTITYTIMTTTGSSVPDATYGFVLAMAGIVRPIGYTDPDATSSDINRDIPGSAEEECEGDCNNIKRNAEIFLLEPFNERGQLALLKEVYHIDSDDSGFFEVGEELEYTFTISNEGPIDGVAVDDIYISDLMLSNNPIIPSARRLNVGESVVIVQRYRLTQADINRKYVENTAAVFGKNPRRFDVKDVSGTAIDNDVPTRIGIDEKPVFQLRKWVVNQGTGQNRQFTLGDTIFYRFEVKHEGDVAVGDIYIRDSIISDASLLVRTVAMADTTIIFNPAPEYHYVVTADDIVAGEVRNSAVLFGISQNSGRDVQDYSGNNFDDDLPTITELARPPQGVDDSYEIYQGQTGLFDVLANDIVGSSSIDKGTLEIVSGPIIGSVTVIAGKIRYTPDSDYYVDSEQANDSFTYRFTDRSRLTSQETRVDIVIKPTIPVAVNDFYKVGYNYYVDIKPLHNDYVINSEILPETIQLTSYPLHGEVRSRDNGIFEYRPGKDYTGYDSLSYTVQDKNGNWAKEAKIVIEVAGFFFSNTITPNGDDKNETFQVIGAYKFDHIEIEVIDRFGRRVYHSNNYKNDWLVPDNLNEGTYFVIFKGIKVNEKPVVRRSTILIKRERYRGY